MKEAQSLDLTVQRLNCFLKFRKLKETMTREQKEIMRIRYEHVGNINKYSNQKRNQIEIMELKNTVANKKFSRRVQ